MKGAEIHCLICKKVGVLSQDNFSHKSNESSPGNQGEEHLPVDWILLQTGRACC